MLQSHSRSACIHLHRLCLHFSVVLIVQALSGAVGVAVEGVYYSPGTKKLIVRLADGTARAQLEVSVVMSRFRQSTL